LVINRYLKFSENIEGPIVQYSPDQSRDAKVTQISVLDASGNLAAHHPYDIPFEVQIKIHVHRKIHNAYLGFHIHDNELRTLIFSRYFIPNESVADTLETGVHEFCVRCPAPLLVPGEYCISVHLAGASPAQIIDGADHVCFFELIDSGSETAQRGFPWRGNLAVPMQWTTIR
jgi:hypothetical protein